MSKVNDPDLAEDLLQETFVIVHTKSKSLRDEAKLQQWIYQVARNLVAMHFRRSRRALFHDQPDNSVNENNMALRCMSSFLKSLPEKYFEIMNMAAGGKVSQKGFASSRNMSYSTVKSRMQRGKQMLKDKMRECCKVESDRYGNIILLEPKRSGGCVAICS